MELLKHQEVAVRFLLPKKTFMLADAPGLGKTATALAVFHRRKIPPKAQSYLVPRNVLHHWKQTALDLFGATYASQLHFTNYEQIANEYSRLEKCQALTLDESHLVKNVEAARFQVIAALCHARPDRDIAALTGTPIFSYPLDLFAQFYCLRLFPDITDSYSFNIVYQNFRTRYCNPTPMRTGRGLKIDYRGCTLELMPELKRKFDPYVLRRTWSDVGLSMPTLTMTDLEVEAKLDHSPQYASAAADFSKWWKDTTGKDTTGLEKFTVLRHMLALAKIPAVLEQIELELKAGIKLLVFSEFRDVAEMLAAAALKLCPNSFLVEGGQAEGRRQSVFELFTSAQGSAVLCATTDSLNVGVNLQAATRVFFVDLGFKPASFVQAVHRSWRLGQVRPVSVVRFVVKNSMDTIVTKNVLTKEGYMSALGLDSTVSLGAR